jgi:MFS superfamily sulfate permease-like transporter
MPNQNKISWQAPEYKHYEKNIGWYVTAVSIIVLIVAFFIIIQSDIFAAVSIAIIGALLLFFSRQKPQIVDIELNENGVKFGNLFYPYKQLKYFWVVHNPRHQTINFHTSAMVNNVFILELEEQDPEIARRFLMQYLPEHSETEETAIQKIMHRFKI